MDLKTRRNLEMFVEKARLLNDRSRYVQQVKEVGLGVSIGYADQQVSSLLALPDDEYRDALLPTFRLFMGDEPVSLRVVKNLLNDGGLSPNWKANFTDVRARIKRTLDKVPLNVQEDGKLVSNWDYWDTFANGGVFHLKDEAKRERFQRWRANPVFFPLAQFFFANVVMAVTEGLFRIAYLTELELQGKTVPIVPIGSFSEGRLRRGQRAAGWKVVLRGRPTGMQATPTQIAKSAL